MSYKHLIVDKRDGIATVTLNRPDKLNALNREMKGELPLLWDELQKDDDVRVTIITGAGRGFCSGADLTDPRIGKHDDEQRWIRLMALGERETPPLRNLPKPTIAAVNGVVAGAGMSICLACDIRIASTKARFTVPFVKRGIVPDGGTTYLLPRAVGLARALELAYTGRMVEAEEAERIGLVNRVVEHDDLLKEARSFAETLLGMPPITLGLVKSAILRGSVNDLDSQLYFETYAQNICASTEDTREAMRAFIEKREPKFTGR